MRLDKTLEKFNTNPPAAESTLQLCEADGTITLPEEYRRFICTVANGGEGFIGPNAYVILWRAEELTELNKAYEVAEYAPGLFLFGSNGGGEAFAFDMRSAERPIVAVPFVGMDLENVQALGSTFNEFLARLHDS